MRIAAYNLDPKAPPDGPVRVALAGGSFHSEPIAFLVQPYGLRLFWAVERLDKNGKTPDGPIPQNRRFENREDAINHAYDLIREWAAKTSRDLSQMVETPENNPSIWPIRSPEIELAERQSHIEIIFWSKFWRGMNGGCETFGRYLVSRSNFEKFITRGLEVLFPSEESR